MKKVISAIIAVLVFGTALMAGNKQLAGSYHSSVLDRDFYIYNDAQKAYIWVAGNHKVDRVQFVMSRYIIDDFNTALGVAGAQFAQYIANEEGPLRPAPAPFPAITVRWRSQKWNTVKNHFLYPYLTHTPNGTPVLLMAGKLRKGKSEKEYVLVFSSLQELQDFRDALSKLEK